MYIWNIRKKNLVQDSYRNLDGTSAFSKIYKNIIIALTDTTDGSFYRIIIPSCKEYDVEFIKHEIKCYLSNVYNECLLNEIIEDFNKFYNKRYINKFDRIEEIEYKHHKEKQEPFKILYRTGKIGGNGFYKDCELVLYGLNKEYFED